MSKRPNRTKIILTCEQCGQPFERTKAAYDYHNVKHGNRIFCSRACKGIDKRTGLTDEQKKERKRLYDQEYRVKNLEVRKVQKSAYHKATYDPAKQAIYNKKRMPHHVEYCRRPEYKAYKVAYDRQRRAQEFGPFADAYLVLLDLHNAIKAKQSKNEIRLVNDTYNKAQRRKREYVSTI